ncbi:MAG: type IV toxin-antitoxin system AbiEi family antitoxin [Terriglobia bacterium]
MLKMDKSMKEVEMHAADALRDLLGQVSVIKHKDIKLNALGPADEMNIVAEVNVSGKRHTLVCEVKSNGQPRYVRTALLQLRNYVSRLGRGATPILIVPYLSPEGQGLCRESEAGFLDLAGNARIVFNGVFIERIVGTKPPAIRRELKSFYKPKAARILRVMLRSPRRAWRVTELAEAAGVSLGHVSNVRTALLDREWARVSPEGLSLSEPDKLLDAWREVYEPPEGRRLRFYTSLHGSVFEEASQKALRATRHGAQAIFASFSAARWLAPYGRVSTQFFYADDTGLDRLQELLTLSSASKGENVIITVPKDRGIFRDTTEAAPGILCTSPVQTYLDLTAAGERGREAAEHLRNEKLRWQ